VQVHGAIGPDGRVEQATVLSAGRPDLEKRAIEIVSSWVFSAPLCNGKPTIVSADLVVHFAPQ
jgi:TonB family protein